MTKETKYSDKITAGDKHYYIDTTDTLDCGWKTMVFEAEITEDGKWDVDWSGIETEHYKTKEEAVRGHQRIVKKYKGGKNEMKKKEKTYTKEEVITILAEALKETNKTIAKSHEHDLAENPEDKMINSLIELKDQLIAISMAENIKSRLD